MPPKLRARPLGCPSPGGMKVGVTVLLLWPPCVTAATSASVPLCPYLEALKSTPVPLGEGVQSWWPRGMVAPGPWLTMLSPERQAWLCDSWWRLLPVRSGLGAHPTLCVRAVLRLLPSLQDLQVWGHQGWEAVPSQRCWTRAATASVSPWSPCPPCPLPRAPG